jgi:YD repeat-containing protein
MSHDVFLSYTRKDSDKALQLKTLLEKEGIQCWLDTSGLRAGQRYADEIETAIRGSAAMIVLLSRSSLRSEWVQNEVQAARDVGKLLIPLKLEKVQLRGGLRLSLSGLHQISLPEEGWDGVTAAIIHALRGRPDSPKRETDGRGASWILVVIALMIGLAAAILPFLFEAEEQPVIGSLSRGFVRPVGDESAGAGTRIWTDGTVSDSDGPVLELTRYYDRSSECETGFGEGWCLLVPYRLEVAGTSQKVVFDVLFPERLAVIDALRSERLVMTLRESEDGTIGYFPPSAPGAEWKGLYVMSNAGYRLENQSEQSFHFDSTGRLTAVDLGTDTRWTYLYDERRVVGIESIPRGVVPQKATVESGGALVPAEVRVDDRISPRSLSLADASVEGWKYTSADGTWREALMLLDGWILLDRWGNEYHFAVDGRFIGTLHSSSSDRESAGSGIALSFDGEGRIAHALVGDRRVEYHYDERGRLVRTTSGGGAAVEYSYDAQGFPGVRRSTWIPALRVLLGITALSLFGFTLRRWRR